jgi:integrase
MHQSGVDAKEIQTILGHRNIQTTYDLYIHETKESKLTATDTLDKVINR